MKEISLTLNKKVLVDDKDYVFLNQYKWYYNSGIKYAMRQARINGKLETIYMHRVITGAKGRYEEVDHINRNTLDNQRTNLRVVDKIQNSYNKGLQSNNTSGFKGISIHKATGKWRARIWNKGIEHHLGLFNSKEMANIAYLQAFAKFAS